MTALHRRPVLALGLVSALSITACTPAAEEDDRSMPGADGGMQQDAGPGSDAAMPDANSGDASSGDAGSPDAATPSTIVDVAAAAGTFTTLVGALQSTGLDEVLAGPGPFTVFAPTDDAFALLPAGLIAGLDSATLTAVLQYHVVSGRVTASQVTGLSAATTVQGGDLGIAVLGSTVVLDGRVQVTQTDIFADNGVIHVIDAVLIPGAFPGTVVDALAASPRFSTLVGAVTSAGLASTLADSAGDGFTVFAPANDAFSMVDLSGLSTAQLAEVLTYHVLGGQVNAATVVTLPSARSVEGSAIAIDIDNGVVLNGSSRVTWTDLETSNGIIHVIDRVLSPRTTVVDLAVAAGDFDTLAGALTSTGLAAALDGSGPFTVFAPTDAAFALLPAGLLASLTSQQLSDILLYHVVGSEQMASDVVMASSATTLGGGSVDIAVRGGRVVLDGRVQVTQTDLSADNGVIHVIDAVLIDGDFPGTVVDALVASPRFSTLVGAVVGADLAGALASAPALTVFAPTDDGFGLLPEGLVSGLDTPTLSAILQYHVLGSAVNAAGAIALSGTADPTVATLQGGRIQVQVDGTVVINGRAQVEYADIRASNGVIHALDSVYLPVDFPGTVVQALSAYPRFSTLVGAVAGQGLVSALSDTSGAGFTVFAPTNSAFAPLDLSGLSAQQLTDTLLYHVLGSPVPATTVLTLNSATTLQGGGIAIDTSSGVKLNGMVDVTFVDFKASNGIIHVLDGVLLIP